MDDLPRQKLAELICRYGREIASDARRCEALLRDACPQHKREIVVLVSAAKESVGVELLNNSSGMPKEVLLSRLAKRLHDNLGIADEFARWAVESWALALQVVTTAGIQEDNQGQVASGLAPLPQPARTGVQIPCPACGRTLRVPEKCADQQLPCPACKAMLQVSVDGRELKLFQPKLAVCDHALPFKKEIAVDVGSGVKLEMVWIPAGEFLMGSPTSDKEAHPEERPRHRVRITKPFYLGKYPITQEQWQAVMGSNPSQFIGPSNPVENVNWNNCQDFLRRLNETVGGGQFQLPSEAQWEYVCRAGSTTRYNFGDSEDELDDYAWFRANSGGKTHPVGIKKPNAWGLYDMLGNVSELCSDWFDGNYYASLPIDDPIGPTTCPGEVRSHITRGGGIRLLAHCYRSAFRRVTATEDGLVLGGLLGMRASRVAAE